MSWLAVAQFWEFSDCSDWTFQDKCNSAAQSMTQFTNVSADQLIIGGFFWLKVASEEKSSVRNPKMQFSTTDSDLIHKCYRWSLDHGKLLLINIFQETWLCKGREMYALILILDFLHHTTRYKCLGAYCKLLRQCIAMEQYGIVEPAPKVAKKLTQNSLYEVDRCLARYSPRA